MFLWLIFQLDYYHIDLMVHVDESHLSVVIMTMMRIFVDVSNFSNDDMRSKLLLDLIVDVFLMNDGHLYNEVFVFYLRIQNQFDFLMMYQMYGDYDNIDWMMIHIENVVLKVMNDVFMLFDEI
jgi:hypothetical protein